MPSTKKQWTTGYRPSGGPPKNNAVNGRNISLYLTDESIAYLDAQPQSRGVFVEALIQLQRADGGPAPSMVVATRELRSRLTTIDDAIAEAQDLADEIEMAAGIVSASGKRIDE